MIEQDNQNSPDQEINLQIELDETVSQGLYSNLVVSNFNRDEFFVDFIFVQPHIQKGKVRARILMSPRKAKLLSQLLLNQVMEYEKKIGPIQDDPPFSGIKLSFN